MNFSRISVHTSEMKGFRPVVRMVLLLGCSWAAVHLRMHSAKRYGAVIDQYKPYHQLRATQAASQSVDGFRFDDRAWYPYGYPSKPEEKPMSSQGLVATSLFVHRVSLAVVGKLFTLYDVCVFLPPLSSVLSVFAAYAFAKEIALSGRDPDGILGLQDKVFIDVTTMSAAFFVGVAPGLVLKSVAGLYDSECLGIWLLLMASYFWVGAVNRGSKLWATGVALVISYLSSVWSEGMTFFVITTSVHVFVLCLSGKYSKRLYVSYTTAVLLSVVSTFAFLDFSVLNMALGFICACTLALVQAARHLQLSAHSITMSASVGAALAVCAGFAVIFFSEYANPISTLSSLVAGSTSEHRPTTWGQFFLDLHLLALLFPSGLYYCIHAPSDGRSFLAVQGLAGMLIASFMVSKITLFIPAACLLGALSIGEHVATQVVLIAGAVDTMDALRLADDTDSIDEDNKVSTTSLTNRMKKAIAKVERRRKEVEHERQTHTISAVISGFLLIGLSFFVVLFWWHSNWVASEVYSMPSIVVPARRNDGGEVVFDDFREAYGWLRDNTVNDAKVLAWWDYGYQLNSLANRTTLVDNAASVLARQEAPGQMRSLQVANVARIMVSTEARAHELLHSLGVEYVMVVFGGVTGYAFDDMSNFQLMAKIASAGFSEEIEADAFYTKVKRVGTRKKRRRFSLGKGAPDAVTQSLVYRLSYSNFALMQTDVDKSSGYDRVRKLKVATPVTELTHFEEMLTTEHWLVRIYKVRPKLGAL